MVSCQKGSPDMSIKEFFRRYDYIAYAALFVTLAITWSLLSNDTWDDDAIGRFQHTQIAAAQPWYFLDSWDRPLFVGSFFFTIRFFGRLGMVIQLSLLLAAGGILLVKTMQEKGERNASLIIVFFLSQTFVFGMSRDAMTEPLVAFLNCLGLYLLCKKRYHWFALVGGLLPLARPEQVLMLAFWALALLRGRKWMLLPLLGWGLGVWWLGLYVYTGDSGAFVTELLKTGATANRYGHLPVAHYPSTYIYVIGPVIFFFFLLGYITRFGKHFSDYFVLLPFTAGFAIYILFSSSLNLGQSDGPLRNLVTLSPFAAIICLYGFNYWMALLPSKTSQLLLYIAVLLVIAFNFFDHKLQLRQYYDITETDYSMILFLILCSVLALSPLVLKSTKTRSIAICLLLLLQVGFALGYEHPSSHMSAERTAINNISDLVRHTSLHEHRIYCNHPWFYWASGYSLADTSVVLQMDSAKLGRAGSGDIILWEQHYGAKPYTNASLAYLLRDSTFVPLYLITTEDSKGIGILFVKVEHNESCENIFAALIAYSPVNKNLLLFKGNYERRYRKDLQESITSYNKALEIDAGFVEAIYQRGVTYFMAGDKNAASSDLARALSYGYKPAAKLLASIPK